MSITFCGSAREQLASRFPGGRATHWLRDGWSEDLVLGVEEDCPSDQVTSGMSEDSSIGDVQVGSWTSKIWSLRDRDLEVSMLVPNFVSSVVFVFLLMTLKYREFGENRCLCIVHFRS